MGNFNFLEYSYNSNLIGQRDVFTYLNKLGFSLRSKHTRNSITFWSQQSCIIMVRDNQQLGTVGRITGIGLSTTTEAITACHDSVPCSATDFFKIDFPVMGFTVYLIEESTLASLSEISYELVEENRYKTKSKSLKFFSGIEVDADNERLKSILETFSFSKDSEDRSRFVSPNKQFTVLFRHKGGSRVASIVCDTPDVFRSTAALAVDGVSFLSINSMPDEFKDLTHKIVGYDCAAFGSYNNYSIEKFIPAQDAFNVNTVIRQRKQFVKLDTTTFDYYDTIKQNCEQRFEL